MTDHDLGPVGGVGSDGRTYGGPRHRTKRQSFTPGKPPLERQVEIALDSIRTECQQPAQLTTPVLVRRLRQWLKDEWDTFLSDDEAMREVQKRQP